MNQTYLLKNGYYLRPYAFRNDEAYAEAVIAVWYLERFLDEAPLGEVIMEDWENSNTDRIEDKLVAIFQHVGEDRYFLKAIWSPSVNLNDDQLDQIYNKFKQVGIIEST